MKKTLLSFVFIFSIAFSFGQAQVETVDDFEVITMEQDTFNLAEFWLENPNTKVALEFFFVDSPLCREISPIISEAYQKTGCNEHDVYFLSINVSDDSAAVVNYRDTLSLETPLVLSDGGGFTLDTLLDIHAYPTLVLLQKDRFTPENDTIWEDEENGEFDTVYVYEPTNFLEKDIWPITDIDSLMSILSSHGIGVYECTEGGSNNSTGFDEINHFQSMFSLYPNPNRGQFNLLSNEIEGAFEIEILDLRGQVIANQKGRITKNTAYQLQGLNLSKGVYIVRIHHQKETWSEKLIVQ